MHHRRTTRFTAAITVSFMLSGCPTLFQTKPNLPPGNELRAALLPDERCHSTNTKGLFATPLLSYAGIKAGEYLIDKLADALVQAAKHDKEPTTVTALIPTFAYSVDAGAPKAHRCLILAAGEASEESSSYPQKEQTPYVPNMERDLKYLGITNPRIYMRIWLKSDKGWPTGYYIAQVDEASYPKSLRAGGDDRAAGILVEVKATTASDAKEYMTFQVAAPSLYPDSMRDDDQTRSQAKDFTIAQKWRKLPKPEPVGNNFATPINLEILVVENRDDTQWLQTLAKYADDHRDKAKDELRLVLDKDAAQGAENNEE